MYNTVLNKLPIQDFGHITVNVNFWEADVNPRHQRLIQQQYMFCSANLQSTSTEVTKATKHPHKIGILCHKFYFASAFSTFMLIIGKLQFSSWWSNKFNLHFWKNILKPFLSLLQVSTFTVSCPVSIGKLVLIELDKQHLPLFPEDSWFPAKVVVKSPEGDTYNFPVYRWITDSEVHRFREGTGLWKFACLTSCTLFTDHRRHKKRHVLQAGL